MKNRELITELVDTIGNLAEELDELGSGYMEDTWKCYDNNFEKINDYERDAKDFITIHKFLYNKVDLMLFVTLMRKSFKQNFDKSYLESKWEDFSKNVGSFAVRHPEFLVAVIKEIEKTNYKG